MYATCNCADSLPGTVEFGVGPNCTVILQLLFAAIVPLLQPLLLILNNEEFVPIIVGVTTVAAVSELLFVTVKLWLVDS